MDKHTPHHSLEDVKRLVREGAVKVSVVAMRNAFALGLEYKDILDTVLSLSRKDFYKSVTSYGDQRSWQDVYHPKTGAGTVYLKLTVREKALILSFKEL